MAGTGERIYAGLRPLLTEEVTLDITEQYDLPDTTDAIAWRFKPAGYERARDVFRRQSDWRRTTYELINATCRLLREEVLALAQKELKRKVK
jgi:hypothetical protein